MDQLSKLKKYVQECKDKGFSDKIIKEKLAMEGVDEKTILLISKEKKRSRSSYLILFAVAISIVLLFIHLSGQNDAPNLRIAQYNIDVNSPYVGINLIIVNNSTVDIDEGFDVAFAVTKDRTQIQQDSSFIWKEIHIDGLSDFEPKKIQIDLNLGEVWQELQGNYSLKILVDHHCTDFAACSSAIHESNELDNIVNERIFIQ